METKLEFNDRLLSLGLARVSEAAAIAATKFIGAGDEKAADQAAVDAMRTQLNMLDINGKIVIGEGERDEAPMLFIGELVGSGNGPAVDIALDPLEGTNLTAKDMPNALTVIAMGPKGSLLNAPDVYMEKIAYGSMYSKDSITLDMSPTERIKKLANIKGCNPSDLMICVLERPRHQILIEEIRSTGARLRLITDGDVAGVIHCANTERTGIDMYMGSGGAPEGVLAAAALDAYECHFQGRFIFDNQKVIKDAKNMGIQDLDKKYELNEIVRGDSIFCATGITSGDIVSGIEINNNEFISETLITHKSSGLKKVRRNKQKI